MDPLGLTNTMQGWFVSQRFLWHRHSIELIDPLQKFVATQAYVFLSKFGGSTTRAIIQKSSSPDFLLGHIMPLQRQHLSVV